jgi:hypothetical protein
VVGAVDQRDLEVDDTGSRRARRCRAAIQALLTPGTYSFGTEPPTISFSNTKPNPAQRLEAQLDARELARTAGLLLVGVVDLGRAC